MEHTDIAVDRNDGSTFHRLRLPLEFINGTFCSSLNEHFLSKYKRVWINQNLPIPAYQISLWKHKYGFQLIYDKDDSWNIPKSHPLYKILSKDQNSKDLCILADECIVSTEPLLKEVQEYNSNVRIIPNKLPFGKGQFIPKIEPWDSFSKRNIRVGLVGSIAHYPNWIECISNLRKVAKLPHIDFIVAGFNPQFKDLWKPFTSISKQVFPALPVTNYIDNYRHFDIILCPLIPNEMNIAKSSLHIYEAACSGSLCFLDPLYESKDHLCDYHYYTEPKYWVEILKNIDKLTLYETIMTASEEIINQTDYGRDCIDTRRIHFGTQD